MRYFTIDELCASTTAKQHNINNTPSAEIGKALESLIINVLDPARERLGKPITVNSGYRCPKLNAKIGGVSTSQHMLGEAADLDTGSIEGNKRLYEIIRDNFQFDQLINEHDFSWVHVSYREGRNRKQLLNLG